MRTLLRTIVLFASLTGAACATPGPDQPPSAYLPTEARPSLHGRMAKHAQEMAALESAVKVLRYEEIAARAWRIADEDRFASPLSTDALEPSAELPERFVQQDRRMRAWAEVLASAAGRSNRFVVEDAYGQLSDACIRCHAIYRDN
jgi:hypothetical protein